MGIASAYLKPMKFQERELLLGKNFPLGQETKVIKTLVSNYEHLNIPFKVLDSQVIDFRALC